MNICKICEKEIGFFLDDDIWKWTPMEPGTYIAHNCSPIKCKYCGKRIRWKIQRNKKRWFPIEIDSEKNHFCKKVRK